MEGIDIHYSTQLSKNNDDLMILDLPEDLLQEIESGKILSIKGQLSDEAIICGSSSSYILRSSETSNALMLVNNGTIEKEAHSILTCEKIIPPLHQVLTLLEESPYTFNDQKKTNVYSFEEIVEKAQASPKEIKDYLEKISSFEWEGCQRIFDEEFRVEALKNVLYLVMKYDWETVSVMDVATANEFRGIPHQIVEALLSTIGNVSTYWEPDFLKVYQVGVMDLFLQNPEYYANEFGEAYSKLLEILIPRRMITNFPLSQILQGIAINRVSNSKLTIRYLPAAKLSYNFQDRLNLLFSIKDKWTEEEIGIYLHDVLTMPLPKALLKYTKRISENSQVMFMNKLN
ncbi:unnamed protein product [Blepharisma stoltei]|uniref:Sister chromatid cohesion protein DCC1 n=1 Tax=Blepharisma stoltei TaxID=1481888 RepID=A0AAU9JTM8_9CILI|nr:unnamed protein product [Blepharisma stoltei]